ncbi:MAG: GMC family oxidoreductase [bacterium]|jgi:cholesterol oxidase
MSHPERSRKIDAWDYVIVGSGFGGSVSALRLVEKGYTVLVLEKGRRWEPEDFPKTNWQIRDWLWNPAWGLRGFFQMSFLKHITVLHGVGVGGGSLVYANTLPRPSEPFFRAPSWNNLADWQSELEPHYATAERMLGAVRNPRWTPGDEVLAGIARDLGRSEHHHPTEVGVFFSEPGVTEDDPYFEGKGPRRTGCTFCGACMTGCRVGAKNTLDRNYLYLAQELGALIQAETEVVAVRPAQGGYVVETRAAGVSGSKDVRAKQVIFAGGVMGTIPLLLEMQQDPDGLPQLSSCLGAFVRTNNEALYGSVTPDSSVDFSKGVAITSILHTSEHSHVEPVRYGAGSGFFRLLALPLAPGRNMAQRITAALAGFLRQPWRWLRVLFALDWARHTQVLLYMQTLEGTLSLALGRDWRRAFARGLVSRVDDPAQAPQAFMPEANDLIQRFTKKVGGVAMSLAPELLLGVPSTAHILGGACMGQTAAEGVIDDKHRVHGYPGLFVIDGSAVSANPGVNPALTITALAERAISQIPAKDKHGQEGSCGDRG